MDEMSFTTLARCLGVVARIGHLTWSHSEVGDIIYVGTNPDTNSKAIFFGSRGLNVGSSTL